MTIAEIGCQELWDKLQRGDEVVLVDALSPISYAAVHLPGAVNIPPRAVDDLADRWIPDPDAEVVVYCANRGCVSSVEVAERRAERPSGARPASRSRAPGPDGYPSTITPVPVMARVALAGSPA